MNQTHPDAELPLHERIRMERVAANATLEEWADKIGRTSKGILSEIERGLRVPTPRQALAIEALSEGRINAADLNEDVRLARHGLPSIDVGVQDHG